MGGKRIVYDKKSNSQKEEKQAIDYPGFHWQNMIPAGLIGLLPGICGGVWHGFTKDLPGDLSPTQIFLGGPIIMSSFVAGFNNIIVNALDNQDKGNLADLCNKIHEKCYHEAPYWSQAEAFLGCLSGIYLSGGISEGLVYLIKNFT